MTLDSKQFQKLATLSRLEFAPEKQEAFSKEFASIVKFVEQIQTLDTTGVPPLTTTADIKSTPERADKVTAPNNREALQKSAIHAEMGFFVVPKIVE